VRLRAATALAILAALALGRPALAQVTAFPASVTDGQRSELTFVVPNERRVPMTTFVVIAPPDVSIVQAVPPGGGWRATGSGSIATWSGGSLPAGAVSSFSVLLEASGKPGGVSLEAHQHYPDRGHVLWKVPLTVLPGPESSGSAGTALVLVAGLGLLLVATLVAVLWLRRRRPPERG
jgi:hypothetical protein